MIVVQKRACPLVQLSVLLKGFDKVPHLFAVFNTQSLVVTPSQYVVESKTHLGTLFVQPSLLVEKDEVLNQRVVFHLWRFGNGVFRNVENVVIHTAVFLS